MAFNFDDLFSKVNETAQKSAFQAGGMGDPTPPGVDSGKQFRAEATNKLEGKRADWTADFQGKIQGALSEAQRRVAENRSKAINSFQTVGTPGAPAGGYKMGAVPNHYGWAGLKPEAKQWSLAVLGQFPGLRFSSGYRSPEANRAANGAANSGHMRGWKADFSGSREEMHAAAEWLKKQGARTLLHDAGSGYHLDVSFEGVPFRGGAPAQQQPQPSGSRLAGRTAYNAGVATPFIKAMVAQEANAAYGWSGAEWNALADLVQRESGFNPAARNPTSTAAGLFQFLDSTRKTYGISRDATVEDQIRAGLKYIKDRYGSPSKALAHWLARKPINGRDVGNWY